MKIIAFIPTAYKYFGGVLPELSKLMEVLPVGLFEVLKKLGDNATEEGFEAFWDVMLSREKYDALLSYGRPDEATLKKCREHKIPILIQEHYGHCPDGVDAVFPYYCDLEKAYGKDEEPEAGSSHGGKEKPVVTVALSAGEYSVENRLDVSIRRYAGRDDIRWFSWRDSPVTNTYLNYTRLMAGIFQETPELADCEVRFRPHPRYPGIFKESVEFVAGIGDGRTFLDYSSAADSLRDTDIIINMNSNYGFDGVRAGCEVVTFENRAFYSNPRLTRSPMNREELKSALIASAAKIRTKGKRIKSFIPKMKENMKEKLAHPCLGPYDGARLKEAIEYAAGMPIIYAE